MTILHNAGPVYPLNTEAVHAMTIRSLKYRIQAAKQQLPDYARATSQIETLCTRESQVRKECDILNAAAAFTDMDAEADDCDESHRLLYYDDAMALLVVAAVRAKSADHLRNSIRKMERRRTGKSVFLQSSPQDA